MLLTHPCWVVVVWTGRSTGLPVLTSWKNAGFSADTPRAAQRSRKDTGYLHGSSSTGEDELLASCYQNSLALAELSNLHSTAFPAISTSAYGFALERAARIAIPTVVEFITCHPSLERVIFVCHEKAAHETYMHIMEREIKSNTKYGVAQALFSHLSMIEMTHGIPIRKREDIVRVLAPVIKDDARALSAGILLNTWVAISGVSGEVTVPQLHH